MSDDKPLDQDEDNDEFFSARSGPGHFTDSAPFINPAHSMKAPGNVDNSPSSRRVKKSARPEVYGRNFFSDEKAHNSEKSSKRREKNKCGKNKWDRREYRKEELEGSPRKTEKRKEKKKKPIRVQTEEASKTDEEVRDQRSKIKDQPRVFHPRFRPVGPQPRPYFQQETFIMRSFAEPATAPKCRFRTLRFASTQEVIEFDGVGDQVQHPKYTDRAITNNWRRWGAYRTLCEQGGY
ncbi:hypothetical protein PMAYCL1PPCAC_22009, partial [Pristionchus mayeri]